MCSVDVGRVHYPSKCFDEQLVPAKGLCFLDQSGSFAGVDELCHLFDDFEFEDEIATYLKIFFQSFASGIEKHQQS